MEIIKYNKNAHGHIKIKAANIDDGYHFVAVYADLQKDSHAKGQRERYINAATITKISESLGAYPKIGAYRDRTCNYDVSTLSVGAFIEIAHPYQKSARVFGLVIENNEKSLLIARFAGFKTMTNFSVKHKANAVAALAKAKGPAIGGSKAALIADRFAEVGSNPSEFVSHFDEVRGDICQCQLCDTPISKAFLITHVSGDGRLFWVGSECVHKQALSSGVESEVIKAEILQTWTRGIKVKKDGTIEGADIVEVEAPTLIRDLATEYVERVIKLFEEDCELYKNWKAKKRVVATRELSEAFVEQVGGCEKTKAYAQDFLNWHRECLKMIKNVG